MRFIFEENVIGMRNQILRRVVFLFKNAL